MFRKYTILRSLARSGSTWVSGTQLEATPHVPTYPMSDCRATVQRVTIAAGNIIVDVIPDATFV